MQTFFDTNVYYCDGSYKQFLISLLSEEDLKTKSWEFVTKKVAPSDEHTKRIVKEGKVTNRTKIQLGEHAQIIRLESLVNRLTRSKHEK